MLSTVYDQESPGVKQIQSVGALVQWSKIIARAVDDLLSQFERLPASRAIPFIVDLLAPQLATVNHTLTLNAVAEDKVEIKITFAELGNLEIVFDLPK